MTGAQHDAAPLPGGHMGFLPDPLHPAVIHFPIVLALVALLVELLARVPRWRILEPAAALLITLAAMGAIAAVVTGDLAHDEAVVPAGADDLVEQHEELGEIAMWSLVGLAAARLLLGWRRRFTGAARGGLPGAGGGRRRAGGLQRPPGRTAGVRPRRRHGPGAARRAPRR